MVPALAETPARLRRLRVLVIDDEPDAVMTLLAILRDEGYDAQGFSSGKEALKAVKHFDPDVVISDLSMPVINGWDIGREVRRMMGEKRPTLIALTGVYKSGSDKLLSDIAGYNHYLTKPCEPKALVALLQPLAASIR